MPRPSRFREILIIALLLSFPLFIPSAHAQIDFTTHRMADVDGDPRVLRIADFDEDGRPDLAIPTGYLNNSVSVLYSRGLARFDRANFPVGQQPLDLAVADFNGDGHQDLAAASSLSNAITVRLGDGTGGFSAAIDYPFGGGHAHRVAAGLFDADGFLDLLAVNFVGDTVTLLRGLGDGTFLAAVAVVNIHRPEEIVADDVNGDGHLDFLIETEDTTDIRIYLGNGAGAFAPSSTLQATFDADELLLADFDEDGHLDLVASGYSPGVDTRLYLGNGSGVFTESVALNLGSPRGLAARDVNGDGHVDLATAQHTESVILLGDGTGALTIHQRLRGPAYTLSVECLDVDDDDVPDLLLADYYNEADQLWILRGVGGGDFEQFGATFAPSIGDHAVREDFDLDGHLDVAIGRRQDGFVVQYGNGTGQFDRALVFANIPKVLGLAAGDFNLDGLPDLAAAVWNAVRIYLGDTNGDLQYHESLPIPYGASAIAAGSFDDYYDDLPDLVLAEPDSDSVSFLRGDGTGHFEFGQRFEAQNPKSLTVADYDEDGHQDVAVGRAGSGLLVRFGNGTGVFPILQVLQPVLGSNHLRTRDLDGDGHFDIAGTSTPDQFFVFYADGSGGFTMDTSVDLDFDTVHAHAIGDFDGDGLLDAAVATGRGRTAIVRNRGDRTFDAPLTFGMSVEDNALVAGDYDEDGDVDLVAGRYYWSTWEIAFLPNVTYHPLRCRSGNVNVNEGAIADTLLVNGSRGTGPSREVTVAVDDPFEIRMETPPSNPGGPARFALYAYLADPADGNVTPLPHDLGTFCMSTFLTDPQPWKLKRVWNNIGRTNLLGEPDLPSMPAPSIVLDKPGGLGMAATFFLQGLIVDAGAPSGIAAVTNGVLVSAQ